MAQRTNVPAVKAILSTSLSTAQIQAFIDDTSVWVDEELTNKGLSANMLEIIERYLTCAFTRLRDLGLKSAKFDDISEQYQVDPEVTDYLLRAAGFDKSGTVRRAFLAPKDVRSAQFRVGQGFVDEALEV